MALIINDIIDVGISEKRGATVTNCEIPIYDIFDDKGEYMKTVIIDTPTLLKWDNKEGA